jgi:pilus assembly protein CpaB
MKNTAQKLILISFILALIASAIVFTYLKSLNIPKDNAKNVVILVAAETIPPRTLIEKRMIKELQVPDSSIFKNYINDTSKIVGKYTKETISKDEGFYTDKLLDNNKNELSLKIDKNHRAISINVTGESGVSDLLKPGDYVDIVAYIAEKKNGQIVVRPDLAKIVLQNIELLAVDKQINRDDNINEKVSSKDKTETNFLVTLSVTPSELERLVYSESIGTIKLALRPMKDNKIIQTSGMTWEQLSSSSSNNVTTAINPIKP